MEQVKPRLQDIATRAGVSVPTVSRVLNGQAGVAEQTRRAMLVVRGSTAPPGAARS
jgi:DNA-binding LacI/PurR family transcriptional regulator